MKTTGIIGFGVLGKQIFNFLKEESINSGRLVVFDDYCPKSNTYEVAPFTAYLDDVYSDVAFYIGLGYNHLKSRKKIISKLLNLGRSVNTFIHHTSYVSPGSVIEEGCILFPFVNIDQNVKILKGNILHNNVIVSHDSILNECSYLSPGAIMCGNVEIDKYCFIGAHS